MNKHDIADREHADKQADKRPRTDGSSARCRIKSKSSESIVCAGASNLFPESEASQVKKKEKGKDEKTDSKLVHQTKAHNCFTPRRNSFS